MTTDLKRLRSAVNRSLKSGDAGLRTPVKKRNFSRRLGGERHCFHHWVVPHVTASTMPFPAWDIAPTHLRGKSFHVNHESTESLSSLVDPKVSLFAREEDDGKSGSLRPKPVDTQNAPASGRRRKKKKHPGRDSGSRRQQQECRGTQRGSERNEGRTVVGKLSSSTPFEQREREDWLTDGLIAPAEATPRPARRGEGSLQ